MCWNCPFLYYIDGIVRCEIDRQELNLGDMSKTKCEKLEGFNYEQRYEKKNEETVKGQINR